ncbi:MAG: hypothetical protein K9H64_11025 [Bacteroidales bacterium]|nr:hypothetical protein [Bacteroidales bacterium]MCF8456483.1 hypothetical protein [Bacteroidales bacterium]
MKVKNIIPFLMVAFLALAGCKGEEAQPIIPNDTYVHKVKVVEVIGGKTYSYLKVEEGSEKRWLATTLGDFHEGQTLYFTSGMEMRNFESKELERTFDVIYFITSVSDQAVIAKDEPEKDPHNSLKSVDKVEINISPAEGGISLAALFENMDSYEGKKVIVSGQVVKYNAGILNRNWVHIQDGSKFNELFDLTITTNDEVALGDTVTFEGIVTLNKDFGSGYKYDIIVMDASLMDQEPSKDI